MRIIVGVFLCLFLLSFVSAQPSITGISGSLVHAGTITITGSGFGVKSPVEPYLWDRLRGWAGYEGLSQGDTIPVGAPLDYNSSLDGLPWRSMNHDVYFNEFEPRILGGATYRSEGGGNTQTYPVGYHPRVWYLNWWERYSRVDGEPVQSVWGSDFVGENCQASRKMLRSAHHPWHDGGGDFAMSQEGARNNVYGLWQGYSELPRFRYDDVTDGPEWINLEIWWDWLDVPDGERGGFYQLAVHSSIIEFAYYLAPVGSGPQLYDTVGLMNASIGMGADWTSIGWTGGCHHIYHDYVDVYADVTYARVMICDDEDPYQASKHRNSVGGPTNPRTHCEVQIPHTQWNDVGITVEVNLGSFSEEQKSGGLFLFVFDERNQRSQPYHLFFEQGVPGDLNGDGVVSLSEFLGWSYSSLRDFVVLGKYFLG